jgi:hypothetical protein
MALLSTAGTSKWSGFTSFVLKEILDNFNGNYVDLDGAPTSDGTSAWSKLTGTSFGTSGGRVNTSITTNSIYLLSRGLTNFTLTASLLGTSGGDAFYFRVLDASNWLRIRCHSTQGAPYSFCTYDQIPGYPYTYVVDSPGGPCFGIFYSTPQYAQYDTFCGQQVLNYTNFQYEYRPDCYTSTPWKLLSYDMLGYTQYTQTRRDNTYTFVLEECVAGVTTALLTRSIVRTEITAVSSAQFNNKITGALPNPNHTLTLSVFGNTVSYSVASTALPSFNTSGSTTTTTHVGATGVGIGRGATSFYTTSGIDNAVWSIT